MEMWICHHVHRPVSALMALRGRENSKDIPVCVGFSNWESFVILQGNDGRSVELKSKFKTWGGWKQRWIHLVCTYDGHTPTLYINGEKVAEGHFHHEDMLSLDQTDLELAAYMQDEPWMQFANLVHRVRIHRTVLDLPQIQERFTHLKERVEEGSLYDSLFHFNARPYLNFVNEESIAMVWETDQPCTSKVEWGTSQRLGSDRSLTEMNRLHETTIQGLAPETPYFYRITCTAADGQVIDSGLLTFKTASPKGKPIRFAVLGDTESRPHINDQLAKAIWSERPHFLLHLGDLTDAGEKPHRYEWTHEYFVGMTQLTSRIPVFAVPGNGESDLHWYKRYHRYPDPEGYYTFHYGDVAFFMLDSNRREDEFAPGGAQYTWLDQQLSQCDAKWKIVCHHHATYTGEEDDYGNAWKEQSSFGDPFVRKIVPLYEKHGVDIAMFGHLHLYERSHPMREGKVDWEHGTMHLLAGGGGGDLEDFAPTPAFFSAKTYPGHHFVMVEAANERLNIRMQGLDGVIRDSFTLEKVDPQRLKLTRSNSTKNK